MIIEDTLTAQNLNGLPFPSGYVSIENDDEIEVTGQKIFKNILGLLNTKIVRMFGKH